MDSFDVGQFGEAFEKLADELVVHPRAVEAHAQFLKRVGLAEQLPPLAIPVAELLQTLPLVLIVADQVGGRHHAVPVVLDAHLPHRRLFQIPQDLDPYPRTNFITFTPTFTRHSLVMLGGNCESSSAACYSLNSSRTVMALP